MFKVLFTIACLSLIVVTSRADDPIIINDTIGELRNKCMIAERFANSEEDNLSLEDTFTGTFAAAYCMGFMEGVGVLLQLNCFDKDYTGRYKSLSSSNGQRIRAFLNWADAHPELWRERQFIAMAGLIEGLPCNQ